MRIHTEGLEQDDGVVFKTVPAGRYPCRITGVEVTETGEQSKNPGRPMLKMKMAIVPGEEHEGHTFVNYQVLPSEGMAADDFKRSRSQLKALCIASGIVVEEDEFDTDDLLDCEVDVIVDVQPSLSDPSQNMNNVKSILESQ